MDKIKIDVDNDIVHINADKNITINVGGLELDLISDMTATGQYGSTSLHSWHVTQVRKDGEIVDSKQARLSTFSPGIQKEAMDILFKLSTGDSEPFWTRYYQVWDYDFKTMYFESPDQYEAERKLIELRDTPGNIKKYAIITKMK